MSDWLSRTQLLLGKDRVERLADMRVAVFGLGGVGGYAAEALVRCGIGAIDLIDNDKICLTNLNRQIYATTETIGEYKTDAAEKRILQINPNISVRKFNIFFTPETAAQFNFSEYNYIVDAIDTVTGKIELAVRAQEAGVRIISAMGAGNKLDPTAFEVADIYKTSVCPLAKVMRYELKRRGVKKLKVVYSKEIPVTPEKSDNVGEPSNGRRQTPGSCSFVPPVAGLIIAGEVIKDLSSAPQE